MLSQGAHTDRVCVCVCVCVWGGGGVNNGVLCLAKVPIQAECVCMGGVGWGAALLCL